MTYLGTEALLHDGAGNAIDSQTYRDQRSIATIPGAFEVFTVTLHGETIVATTGYMLIDISDTVTWPHTNTDRIFLHHLNYSLNPTNIFAGAIEIGFLTDVDTANGDFHILAGTHFIAGAIQLAQVFGLTNGQVCCCEAQWFGPTDANDPLWQSNLDIEGPDGNVAYPSGHHDLVLKLTRTAGQCDFSITLGYTTAAPVV